MATLTDQDLQRLLDNPNTNAKIKQQIQQVIAGEEKQKEKFLFVIENYHPISTQDYKQDFILTGIIIILLIILILL